MESLQCQQNKKLRYLYCNIKMKYNEMNFNAKFASHLQKKYLKLE